MSGILQFLENAVQPTAAARSGYLQGQREDAATQAAAERASLLDRLKQSVDESTIARNNAAAAHDLAAPTVRPVSPPPPHTLTTKNGHIMQWDPAQQKYVDSGMIGYVPGSSGGAGSANQQAVDDARAVTGARTQLQSDLTFVPRPSKVPKPAAKITTENGVTTVEAPDITRTPAYKQTTKDSLDYDAKVLQPDRQRLRTATQRQAEHLGLPADATAPVPEDGAGAAVDPEKKTAYDTAANAYRQALAEGADPAEALKRYQRAMAAIALHFNNPTSRDEQ